MAGQEYFGIRIDTDKLEQDAAKAKKAFDEIGKEAEKQGSVIDKAFSGSTLSINLEKQLKNIEKLSVDAFGGISSNAQRIIKEIQEDTLSLSNVEKVMSALNAAYEKGTISQTEYINAASRMEVLHRNISAAIQENEKALKAETTAVEKLASDSMVALQAKVTLLTTEYMKLSEAQRNSIQGETLLKNISEVQTKLSSAQAAMNKYGGVARAQFDMLGMSIQQIARELPSLTISPQMFFLAISNNLPIFTDALARARQEFQAMTATGKQAVPVWKQVAKSLLSWQTALSLLPTLLIVYGDDIVSFFKRISGGVEDVDKAVSALNGLKQALAKGTADAQNEVVRLNLLYDATQDVTKSTSERLSAIKELKDEFPSYFKNLTDEEIMAGKAADSYERLSKSIIASANARAAEEMMVENSKKILENQQKINDEYTKQAMLERELAKAKQRVADIEAETADPTALRGNQRLTAARQTVTSLSDQIAEIDEAIAGYRSGIYKLNKAQLELKDSINIEDLLFDSKSGEGSKKKAENNLKQYLNELLGLQEDNEERQIELTKTGTEKQLALIELRYKRQIEAVKKLQEELKKAQGGKLTDEQQGIFGTALSGLQGMKQAETTAVQNKQLEAERKAMQDYLAEYGDYWEKRKAIAEKYQDEIANATTRGEKLSLQKQLEEELKSLDFENLKSELDFSKVFGNLDFQTTESLRVMRDKLSEYINSAAQQLDPEDLKELQDAFDKIDFEMVDRDPFGELKSSIEEYKSASKDVKKAQEDLNTVMSGGEVITGVYMDENGKLVKQLLSVTQAENNLETAQSKRRETLSKLTSAANNIGSKGMEVVNAGNDIVNMLENFGVKVPEAISDALDGLGQVMSGLASIDLTKPFSAITGLIKVLTGIGNTIAGLFGFGGADYTAYNNLKTQYEGLIDIWDELIDKKLEYIDIDYGVEAQKAAEEAIRLTETQIERQRQLANMLASSGASVGSHSLGYRVNERMSYQDWQNLSSLIGQQVDSLDDVLNLDADVIGQVLQDEKFVSVLTTVNSDFIEYIQNIEKYGEQLEEIAEKEKEAITGIGADEFFDEYTSLLSDLDSTNEDFADNFEEYMKKAILNSLVANQYKSKIEELYNKWAEYGEDGLTTYEANELKQMQEDIANSLIAERDKLKELFGWSDDTDTSQTATSRGFETMSQDTADELNGRFTALYESNLRIETQISIGNVNLQATKDAVTQMRDITQNCYLELVEIRENTGAVVKPIQQMQKDMAEMKNTIKERL